MNGDLQTIEEQFLILLNLLERTVVTRQLLAILVVVVVSLVVGRLIDGLFDRLASRFFRNEALMDRFLPALGMGFFPVIALGLIYFTQVYFETQGFLAGLIDQSLLIFWVLLGYSVLMLVLYGIFGERVMRPYQRQVFTPALIIGIALVIIGGFFDLRLLSSVQVFNRGDTLITIGTVATAIFTLYLVYIVNWIVRSGLRGVLSPRRRIKEGVVDSIITISSYVLIGAGIVASLAVLGLDLTTLSFVAGGLSVGIGFGLQSIVSNFISGILMLFEQSLRPGDWVEIDGRVGVVQRLGIRSTTVRTLDNVDRIVPNENFLGSTVSNYTTSNYTVRQVIEVGVSYKSNPRQVHDILLRVAKLHEDVLIDPAPFVLFRNYGDSSLDFWLVYYLSHPRYLLPTKSDLLFEIFQAFEKQGIVIPFPQRDLNLGDGWREVFDSHRRDEHTRDEIDNAESSQSS